MYKTPGVQKLHRGLWVPKGDIDASTLAKAARLVLPQGVLADEWATWALVGRRLSPPSGPVRVVVPPDDFAERRDRLFVRHASLPAEDVVVIGDLAVTGGTRTAVDVLCDWKRLGRYRAIELVDALLNVGATTVADVRAVLALTSQRGVVRARELVEETEPGAESGQETRLRLIVVDGGLPRPKAQWIVTDENGIFVARCDLGYDDADLGLEYHGKEHKETLAYDWDRAGAIDVRGGARVLAFVAEHLRTPQAVVRRVRLARERQLGRSA